MFAANFNDGSPMYTLVLQNEDGDLWDGPSFESLADADDAARDIFVDYSGIISVDVVNNITGDIEATVR